MERDWAKLGPKLRGKIHVTSGTMDNGYLNNAVYYLDDFFKAAKIPPAGRGRHLWRPTGALLHRRHVAPQPVRRAHHRFTAVHARDGDMDDQDGSRGRRHQELAVPSDGLRRRKRPRAYDPESRKETTAKSLAVVYFPLSALLISRTL